MRGAVTIGLTIHEAFPFSYHCTSDWVADRVGGWAQIAFWYGV